MTELIRYDAARQALAEAHSVDEAKDIRDKAVAMQAYARQAKDGDLIAWATEIRLRAERKAGQLLKEMAENGERKGGRGGDRKSSSAVELEDLNLTKKQSFRWRSLAAMEQGRFESHVETAKQKMVAAVEGGSASPMPEFTGDFEWYTPREIIDLAVEVMGGIDVDPASCADANKVVGAKVFYSKDDDGLTREWRGRVWLNPPYATELIRPFTSILLEKYASGEVTEAIVLTNNVTETLAIQSLIQACCAITFPLGRIKFYKTTDPERANGAGHGQALFYFGKDRRRFVEVFGRIGEVVYPVRLLAGGAAAWGNQI